MKESRGWIPALVVVTLVGLSPYRAPGPAPASSDDARGQAVDVSKGANPQPTQDSDSRQSPLTDLGDRATAICVRVGHEPNNLRCQPTIFNRPVERMIRPVRGLTFVTVSRRTVPLFTPSVPPAIQPQGPPRTA